MEIKIERKSTKAKLLQLKLLHIFIKAIILMKKGEIEKNKPTFIYSSVLKVECPVALVSSIFNFFINKFALANKWMRKIRPSPSNSALVGHIFMPLKKARLMYL